MNKTRNLVMAALLTALSIIITFSPFKLPVPAPFSVTLGSHVPTMIAMFINPWVALFTVIGSCIGFWISLGNIIIVLRAAWHIVFVVLGIYMMRKNINIFIVIIATSIVHAFGESMIVYIFTPLVFSDQAAMAQGLALTTFIGSIFHHYVDCLITAPILYALYKAKFVNTSIFKKAVR